jgi:membrane-associated phospholipid phosphatase
VSRPLFLRLGGGFATLVLFPSLGATLVRAFAGRWITASFDVPIVEYTAVHRVNSLTIIMKGATAAGDELTLWIAVLVGGALFAWLTRSWRPLLLLMLAMIGAVSLESILKFLVARARPPLSFWATPASGWSFPSGHATESAAVCLIFAYLFARTRTSSDIRALDYVTGFTATYLIGVSRVYLGVHWPTDVICGWAIGGAWSAIVIDASATIQDSPKMKAIVRGEK